MSVIWRSDVELNIAYKWWSKNLLLWETWKDNLRMVVRNMRYEDMDWFQLAEDREASRGFLLTCYLAFRFHKRQEISLPAERLLIAQRLRFMESLLETFVYLLFRVMLLRSRLFSCYMRQWHLTSVHIRVTSYSCRSLWRLGWIIMRQTRICTTVAFPLHVG